MACVALTDTALFLLAKLGRLATDRFSDRLRPTGLRPPHCSLLAVLAQRQVASQLELGRLLGQAPSGIVAMLDDLERLGAIHRVRDDVDRRRHVVALTPAGRDLLARAGALALEVEEELLAGVDPADRDTVRRVLGGMAGRLGVLPAAD
jgi:DNA-binding MarR family transcriptional regulator